MIILSHHHWPFFKESADLIVGVLSKRENFLERKTIRETWYRYAQSIKMLKNHSLKIFFILGQECLIPSQYKLDPYTCDILKINETEDFKNEIQVQKVNLNLNINKPIYLYHGFSFQACYSQF